MEEDKSQFLFNTVPEIQRGQTLITSFSYPYFITNNYSTILIYDISKLQIIKTFTQHRATVTAIRISHNAKFVASGDKQGRVLIWSLPHFQLLNSFQNLLTLIKDFDWSSDSQKVAVVGIGKSTFGKVLSISINTIAGQFIGVTKNLNAVAITSKKPYKMVVGGDQAKLLFYEGIPIKFIKSQTVNKSYINCIRMCPDDSKFVVCSSDKSLVIYDWKDFIIKQAAHEGTVSQCCWIDINKLCSSSFDKTIKIWNGLLELLHTLKTQQKPDIGDFQVSVQCSNQIIISVSLNGNINIWNNQEEKPQVLSGANSPIKKLIIKEGLIYAGQTSGNIIIYENQKGKKIKMKGQIKTMQSFYWLDLIYIIYLNGTIRVICPSQFVEKKIIETKEFFKKSALIHEQVYIYNGKTFFCLKNDQLQQFFSLQEQIQSFVECNKQILCSDTVIILNQKGNIFFLNSTNQPENNIKISNYKITQIQVHSSKPIIALGDSSGAIIIWNYKEQTIVHKKFGHTAKITSLNFSENYLASTSNDRNVVIWNLEKQNRHWKKKDCHKGGGQYVYIDKQKRVYSSGNDSILKCNYPF